MRAKHRKPPPWPTPTYSTRPSSAAMMLVFYLTLPILNASSTHASFSYATSLDASHATTVKWTCPNSTNRELGITVNSSVPLTLHITEEGGRQICRRERIVSTSEGVRIPEGQCGTSGMSPFSLPVAVRRFDGVDVLASTDFEFDLTCPISGVNASTQPVGRMAETNLLRLELIPNRAPNTTSHHHLQRHEAIFGQPYLLVAKLRRTEENVESSLPVSDSDWRSISPRIDGKVIGFRIHSCAASSPLNAPLALLTDDAGCSLHRSLVSDFVYSDLNERDWTATTEIPSMFRFTSSNIVKIQCQYELCRENSLGCSESHLRSAEVECPSHSATETGMPVVGRARHRREVANFTVEEEGSGEEGDDQSMIASTDESQPGRNPAVEHILNSATTESRPLFDYSVETEYFVSESQPPHYTTSDPTHYTTSGTTPLGEDGDIMISVEINATYATSTISPPVTESAPTTPVETSQEPSSSTTPPTTTLPISSPLPTTVVVVYVVDAEKDSAEPYVVAPPEVATAAPHTESGEERATKVVTTLNTAGTDNTTTTTTQTPTTATGRAETKCNSTDDGLAGSLQMYGMGVETLFKLCVALCFVFTIGSLLNLLICCFCVCGRRRSQRAERREGEKKRRSAMLTSSSTYSFSGLSTSNVSTSASAVRSSQVVTGYNSSTAPRNWRLTNGDNHPNSHSPPPYSSHLNKRLSGHAGWVNGVYAPSRPGVSFYGGDDQQVLPASSRNSRRESTNSFAAVKKRSSTLQPYSATQPIPAGGLLQYVGNSRSPNRSSTSTLGTNSTTPVGNISLVQESSLSHHCTTEEEAGEGTLRPTRMAPAPPAALSERSERSSNPYAASSCTHQSSPSTTRTSTSGSSANNTNPRQILTDVDGAVTPQQKADQLQHGLRTHSFTGDGAGKETTPLSSFSSSSNSRCSRTTPPQEHNQGYEGGTIQLNSHEAYSIL